MNAWQQVWREGIAPQLSTPGLLAIRDALAADDPRLTQGAVTSPPPLQCADAFPVEGACAIGFAAWQGDGLATVGAVEEYFARVCGRVGEVCGEPGAARYFLNHFDDT